MILEIDIYTCILASILPRKMTRQYNVKFLNVWMIFVYYYVYIINNHCKTAHVGLITLVFILALMCPVSLKGILIN